jgi:hypothetical protein
MVAPVDAFPRVPGGASGSPAYVSGVEGPERIAPPGRPSQGDSGILQGSIRSWAIGRLLRARCREQPRSSCLPHGRSTRSARSSNASTRRAVVPAPSSDTPAPARLRVKQQSHPRCPAILRPKTNRCTLSKHSPRSAAAESWATSAPDLVAQRIPGATSLAPVATACQRVAPGARILTTRTIAEGSSSRSPARLATSGCSSCRRARPSSTARSSGPTGPTPRSSTR